MLSRLDFSGNPYIGVYVSANEGFLVSSPGIGKDAVRKLGESLEVTTISSTLGGSTVVGALMCANSNGTLVTNFIDELEKEQLADLHPVPIQHKLNAVGNNILCNDRAALAHPAYPPRILRLIADVLGVETLSGTIAGLKTVGAAAVATNKGILCHPHVSEERIKMLEEFFKVPVTISTANYGTPVVGACMVANTKGAVVGSTTTAIELGRIEEGLGYI